MSATPLLLLSVPLFGDPSESGAPWSALREIVMLVAGQVGTCKSGCEHVYKCFWEDWVKEIWPAGQ